jgi:hypothetical protein
MKNKYKNDLQELQQCVVEWICKKTQDDTKSYKVVQWKTMPCNARENKKKQTPPPYTSDVSSTSKRVQLSLKQNTDKKTYGWANGRHVGGPQWQDTPLGSETEFRKRKLNQISRECLPDEISTVVVLSSEEGPKAGKVVEGVG